MHRSGFLTPSLSLLVAPVAAVSAILHRAIAHTCAMGCKGSKNVAPRCETRAEPEDRKETVALRWWALDTKVFPLGCDTKICGLQIYNSDFLWPLVPLKATD